MARPRPPETAAATRLMERSPRRSLSATIRLAAGRLRRSPFRHCSRRERSPRCRTTTVPPTPRRAGPRFTTLSSATRPTSVTLTTVPVAPSCLGTPHAPHLRPSPCASPCALPDGAVGRVEASVTKERAVRCPAAVGKRRARRFDRSKPVLDFARVTASLALALREIAHLWPLADLHCKVEHTHTAHANPLCASRASSSSPRPARA
mmetsp:Transcript_25770/g.81206  ORF Transcript_25770/g.81206 Transcript_25770/m.81206 type:complete len:206 (+) Transcript_25770:1328-1945(+)